MGRRFCGCGGEDYRTRGPGITFRLWEYECRFMYNCLNNSKIKNTVYCLDNLDNTMRGKHPTIPHTPCQNQTEP